MFKLFKNLKRNELILVFLSVIFVTFQVWLDLKLPDYMADITTTVQTPGSTVSDVLSSGYKMLICAFVSLISSFIVGFFAARIAAGFSRRIRSMLFKKVESFSMQEINEFSTSSLITRSTNDITQVQMLIAMGLQVMVKAPIMAVWAIAKIYGKNWQWSSVTAVSVLILIIMISIIMGFTLPKFKIIQTLTDNLNRVTRENLTGIRVVRAYNAEEYQAKKFDKANSELTNTHLFTSRMMAMLMPVITCLLSGISLAIYWIGAYLIEDAANPFDKMSLFSDMVVYSSYAIQVVMSFMMLTMIFIIYPRASVSAKRINEVLDTKAAINDGLIDEIPEDNIGEVEFKNVYFKYPDAEDYVLEDISFKAKKGETVAFIGSTGSGKSTLINLVPRFYDVTKGDVFVDGINVKEYTQEALHNIIGYVPQKAVLFSGSVSSNISYGNNLSDISDIEEYDNAIKKAIEIGQAKDFVESMDDQYEGHIAQGGGNISGGQKQRLAIARAVCRKPQIYIFDDSFSALDYKTDRVLRTALKKETSGTTSLIVAQRIGTIIDADKIIVLDEGKVVGIGTHKELLKSCEVYQQIALSQLSKEELSDGE